jgi:hypothetical protein
MPTYTIRATVASVLDTRGAEDGRFIHGLDNWKATISAEDDDPYKYFNAGVEFTLAAESEDEARAKAEMAIGDLGFTDDGRINWGLRTHEIDAVEAWPPVAPETGAMR